MSAAPRKTGRAARPHALFIDSTLASIRFRLSDNPLMMPPNAEDVTRHPNYSGAKQYSDKSVSRNRALPVDDLRHRIG